MVTLKWSLHKHIVLFLIVILGKILGNILEIHWDIKRTWCKYHGNLLGNGEFGENTLIIQSSKIQKSILGSSSKISRESSLA